MVDIGATVGRIMPVKHLADAVRAEMERGLLSGDLAPGQVFDERSLAERFGVSRTPVREAIRTLAVQGLLKVIPRFGVVVPKLNTKEHVTLLEMLAELEGVCAMFAARRMDGTERNALRDTQLAYEAAARARKLSSCFEENKRFHETISMGARNEWAVAQIHNLRLRCVSIQRFRLEPPVRLKQTIQEHRAIVASIAVGDEERARHAMIKHIIAARPARTE